MYRSFARHRPVHRPSTRATWSLHTAQGPHELCGGRQVEKPRTRVERQSCGLSSGVWRGGAGGGADGSHRRDRSSPHPGAWHKRSKCTRNVGEGKQKTNRVRPSPALRVATFDRYCVLDALSTRPLFLPGCPYYRRMGFSMVGVPSPHTRYGIDSAKARHAAGGIGFLLRSLGCVAEVGQRGLGVHTLRQRRQKMDRSLRASGGRRGFSWKSTGARDRHEAQSEVQPEVHMHRHMGALKARSWRKIGAAGADVREGANVGPEPFGGTGCRIGWESSQSASPETWAPTAPIFVDR